MHSCPLCHVIVSAPPINEVECVSLPFSSVMCFGQWGITGSNLTKGWKACMQHLCFHHEKYMGWLVCWLISAYPSAYLQTHELSNDTSPLWFLVRAASEIGTQTTDTAITKI